MRRRIKHEADDAEVDMTPMLDIVFIMLIFFIVTTSFVKESGVNLERPSNAPQDKNPKPTVPIVVKIDDNDTISMDGRELDWRAIRANIERKKAQNSKAALIISTSKDASTKTLIRVVDAAKLAHIKHINVATEAIGR